MGNLKYKQVEIDLGTGDGRYVFKNAIKNPNTFYLGIDPSHKQLEIYKKKANRKKIENVEFLVGSLENLPTEYQNKADVVTSILPWGSLLQTLAEPNVENLKKITNLLKPQGILKVVLGYAQETEPTETTRLTLENITEPYIRKTLIPKYQQAKLSPLRITPLTKIELKNIQSTWAKKLAFGKDRPMFYLEFQKNMR